VTKLKGDGVELAAKHTSSSYLHRLLLRAQAEFPQVFAAQQVPSDAQIFRERYGDVLVEFEGARAASPQRAEIARHVCREAEAGMRFVARGSEVALSERMAHEVPALPLVRVDRTREPEFVPSVSFEGKLYRGNALLELAIELQQRHFLTDSAFRALNWIVHHSDGANGVLSLAGQRFVLLGAAAELAPTDMLLEAGAEVLWIDVREPSSDYLMDPRHAGVLHYVKGGADLLSTPQQILATVRAFTNEAPAHLWMYAYAGGGGQEWRLTAAMNAIARALPQERLKSLAMLVSPTTAGLVSPEDAVTADARKRSAPAWKRALSATGQLREGQLTRDAVRVSRSIVPIQGVSYQAAQYVGKQLFAEASATYGNQLGEQQRPLTVSANVAPITATRSLAHPMFEAAFLGAALFDIWISRPSTTRALNGLLAIHDVLNPAASCAAEAQHMTAGARARAVLDTQVHGGLYAQPFALEGCIAVAALQGLARRPKLALGLLR
jgi:hypothetical protein